MWFCVFLYGRYPWLCNRDIYIAGESYAGHFTVQLATALSSVESDLCSRLGGVLIGNGVVDINQTNYAWFEAGASHTLVEESTFGAMRAACDFTKDLGIDGNGCPRGVSDRCAALVENWMQQSGSAAGLLSLYDYYADVCLANATITTTRNPRNTKRQALRGLVGPRWDACSESHTQRYST